MRLITSDSLNRRVGATNYLLFLGTLTSDDPANFVAIVGMRDVETALEAWLRDEPVPPPTIPPKEQLRAMVTREKGVISLAPLKEWITDGDNNAS